MSDINTVINETKPASDDDIFKYKRVITGTISQTQKEEVGDLEELLKKINNYDDTFFENRAKEEQKRKEEQAKKREEELEKRKEEYYEERINKEQEYLAQINEEEELDKEERISASAGFTERFLNIKKFLTKEKERPMNKETTSEQETEVQPVTEEPDKEAVNNVLLDQSILPDIPDDVDLSDVVNSTIGEAPVEEDIPVPNDDPVKEAKPKELFDITGEDVHEPTLEEKEEEIIKNHRRNFLKGIFIKNKNTAVDKPISPAKNENTSDEKEEKSDTDNDGTPNFETMSDKEYDEYLSEEQNNLKKRIKDEHIVSPVHSVDNIILRIRQEQEQGGVDFILLTTADFNTLFIFENVNKFLEVSSEINNNIDFSYLYVVLRRGALYLGNDEYDNNITVLFTNIGNELKRMKDEMYLDFSDPEDFAKIKTIDGINIFKNIYVT